MKLASISPDKASVVARIKAERAVAIIRTDSIERALAVARAVIDGGFEVLTLSAGAPLPPP